MSKKFMGYLRHGFGLIKKDYLLLLNRRKYLYLAILLPLILSLVYIFTIQPQQQTIQIGVCDFDDTPLTNELIKNIKGFEVVKFKESNCVENLKLNIKNNKFIFGLIIEKGFTQKQEDFKRTSIKILHDNSDITLSNYIRWQVDSALLDYKTGVIDATNNELKKEAQEMENQVKVASKLANYIASGSSVTKELDSIESSLVRVQSIDTEFLVNPVSADTIGIYDIKKEISSGIASIFPIVTIFVLLMLVSTNILYDKKSYFIARIKASQTPSFTYILSKLLFFLIITLLQFIVVIVIFLIMGASFSINYLGLVKVLLLISFIDTLIGILIGLMSDSEGVAILISLILTLPFMFLSGIFYPLRLMPSFFQIFADIFPINSQILMLKKVMLFSQDIIFMNLFYILIILFVLSYYYMKRQ